jgi:protein AroM
MWIAKTPTVGIVATGQTPRPDLLEQTGTILGPNVKLTICGALDDATRAQIDELTPKQGDKVLVTKLRDGTTVDVALQKLTPYIQKCVESLTDRNVDLVMIACTGEFPEFKSKRMLLQPSKLLHNVVLSVISKGKLGIVVPLKEQMGDAAHRWHTEGIEVNVQAASPWDNVEVTRAIDALKKFDPDLIVADCYGFVGSVVEKIRRETGKSVVAPCELSSGIAKTLLQ